MHFHQLRNKICSSIAELHDDVLHTSALCSSDIVKLLTDCAAPLMILSYESGSLLQYVLFMLHTNSIIWLSLY